MVDSYLIKGSLIRTVPELELKYDNNFYYKNKSDREHLSSKY